MSIDNNTQENATQTEPNLSDVPQMPLPES
jgi:hypothetical protein